MVIKGKWRKAELHKRMYFIFPHIYFFARIVLLVQGTILSSRQIVTCKQHSPLTTIFFSRNAVMSINHCTFSQQYSILITHWILCRILAFWNKFWNTVWLNEGLNEGWIISLKGNCTSSERNTACLEECSICCRDTASYTVEVCSEFHRVSGKASKVDLRGG